MRTYKRQTSEGFHEQNKKTPEKKKAIQSGETFFKVMLSIVMVFVVLAGGACFAYHKVTGEWPFGGDTIAKDADETSMLDALWAEI